MFTKLVFGMKGQVLSLAFVLQAWLTCGALVWEDEFDGATLNERKWIREILPAGMYNNELQRYTSNVENAWTEDGFLHIKALPEGNSGFTSARLLTKRQGDWLYGYVEVRAKLPNAQGLWPAIWMLPTDNEYGNWPNSGEIDIMEHITCEMYRTFATIHTGSYNHMINTQIGEKLSIGSSLYHDFHLYKLRWDVDSLSVGVDDNWYFTFDKPTAATTGQWPFDKRFYLILNIAVGGDLGGWCLNGQTPILTNDNVTSSEMVVDYVRVYDDPNDAGDISGGKPDQAGCTTLIKDPYATGSFQQCCSEEFVSCLKEWEPDTRPNDFFYKCAESQRHCDLGLLAGELQPECTPENEAPSGTTTKTCCTGLVACNGICLPECRQISGAVSNSPGITLLSIGIATLISF